MFAATAAAQQQALARALQASAPLRPRPARPPWPCALLTVTASTLPWMMSALSTRELPALTMVSTQLTAVVAAFRRVKSSGAAWAQSVDMPR